MTFKGTVGNLRGSCPALSFNAGGLQVRTDAATRFKDGECSDMRNGIDVTIDGTVQAGGVIDATKVELKKKNKDD